MGTLLQRTLSTAGLHHRRKKNSGHAHTCLPPSFTMPRQMRFICSLFSRRVFGTPSPAQHGAMFPSTWRKVHLPSRFITVQKVGREFWKTRTRFWSINSDADVGSRIAPWQGIVGRPSTDPLAGRARCCDGPIARNSQEWRRRRRETPVTSPVERACSIFHRTPHEAR